MKRETRRGYKNLLEIPNVLPVKDFPRPHRKATMATVFGQDIKKRHKEARNVAIATASLAPTECLPLQYSGDIVLGVDLRIRKHHSNAVAAAMDSPYVPNSRVLAVRAPIQVPPQYLAKLQDVSKLKAKLKAKDVALQEFEKNLKKSTLDLSFDDSVDPDERRWSSEHAKLFANPEPQDEEEEHEFLGLHKSSWVRDARRSTLSNRKTDHDGQSVLDNDPELNSMLATRPVTAEPLSMKNVEYMLSIWEKAEGATSIAKLSKDPNFKPLETLHKALLLTAAAREEAAANANLAMKRGSISSAAESRRSSLQAPHQPVSRRQSKIGLPPRPPSIVSELIEDNSLEESMVLSRSIAGNVTQSPWAIQDLLMQSLGGSEEDFQRLSVALSSARNSTTNFSASGYSNFSNVSLPPKSPSFVKSSQIRSSQAFDDILKPESQGSGESLTGRVSTSTISHSTLRFLKRLSREGQFTSMDATLTSENDPSIETAVRKTLTGDDRDSGQSMEDPFTIAPQLDIQAALSESSMNLMTTSRPRTFNTTPNRQKGVFKRGKWIQQIEELVLDDDEAPLRPTRQSTTEEIKDEEFRLHLPDEIVDDMSTEAGSIAGERAMLNANDHPQTYEDTTFSVDEYGMQVRNERESTMLISDRLREIFGNTVVIPPTARGPVDWTAIFKPVKISNGREKSSMDSIVVEKKVFNITRFVSLVKTATRHHPSDKKFDPAMLEGPLVFTTLIEFLESPLIHLDYLPPVKSNPRNALIKALTLGLREESDILLQFESCRLLIGLGGQSDLGRWDLMILKSIMEEMIKKGNEDEKDAAALTFVHSQTVSSNIVDQIRSGFGHQDEEKRNTAVEAIASIDVKYSNLVIPKLLGDIHHTSWRVRLDVVNLLAHWILKLSPPVAPAPPGRDPDALETDDDVTIKALFHTLGTLTNDPGDNEDAILLGEAEKSEKEPKKSTDAAVGPEEEVKEDWTRGWSPELIQERTQTVQDCVGALLDIMWNDWNKTVRDQAASALGQLKQGRPIFDWVVKLLQCNDPVKRVDALRCLTYLGVMTTDSMPMYRQCFKDPYATVRIEACKVACTLRSDDRSLMNDLFDLLDDYDHRVRAYAVKALGYCPCKEPKNRETLNWALHHDRHPTVRAEAVRSAWMLGLIVEDQTIKEGVFTLLETDKSEVVRKEAEKALLACGLIFAVPDADSNKKDATRLNNHGHVPYPHLLNGRVPSEADIFLRESLIGEKESTAVIEQVRSLANKDEIMAQVEYVIKTSQNATDTGLDLRYDSEFTPKKPVMRSRPRMHDPLNRKMAKYLSTTRAQKTLALVEGFR